MEQKKIIGIGGGLFLLFLLLFFLTNKGCSRKNFSWRETYDISSKEPYGAYVFYELLKNTRAEDDFELVEDSLKNVSPWQNKIDNTNYVLLGAAMYLDSASQEALLNYVDRGNNAFISSKTIPLELFTEIYNINCTDYALIDYAFIQDSTAQFNFLDDKLRADSNFRFDYYKRFAPTPYNWNYIDPNLICNDLRIKQLGKMNDFYPNYLEIQYGDGKFFLHTTPMAFSNFSLNKEKNIAYAENALAYLNDGKIFYDDYNKISEGVGRRRNRSLDLFSKRTFKKENELSYILSQPALRWAWYLTLALVLLYLIFRAKREQRIIPVLEKNKNTSLEFIESISQLYYQKGDHKKLAKQMMQQWLRFVRDKYRIPSTKLDQDFVKRVATKSEIPDTTINGILSKYDIILKATGIQQHTLIAFHKSLEDFYKQTK